jgi:elongator complex protein 4
MFDHRSHGTTISPFKAIIKHLQTKLATSAPTDIHRIVIPSLLLPTLYFPQCTQPPEILQFLHGLRAILRQYPTQLTAIITLPISLFPRSAGLVRWMELLCDGVIELIPLPANPAAPPPPKSSSNSEKQDQAPQGLLKVHTLPVYHEKGGGGAATSLFRETLAFSLSASRGLTIKEFSLPPVEGEEEAEKPAEGKGKEGIEF